MKKKPITRAEWAAVRLFAMDVDGVLTDGTVFVSSDGTETKRFSILDGLGLKLLHPTGLILAWISGRESKTTTVRAAELQIPYVIQGKRDKLSALSGLASKLGIPLRHCAYMGDDIIDTPAIEAAGIGISVPDALASTLAAADYVTHRRGGHGAVREICDFLLAARGSAPRKRPGGGRPS